MSEFRGTAGGVGIGVGGLHDALEATARAASQTTFRPAGHVGPELPDTQGETERVPSQFVGAVADITPAADWQ